MIMYFYSLDVELWLLGGDLALPACPSFQTCRRSCKCMFSSSHTKPQPSKSRSGTWDRNHHQSHAVVVLPVVCVMWIQCEWAWVYVCVWLFFVLLRLRFFAFIEAVIEGYRMNDCEHVTLYKHTHMKQNNSLFPSLCKRIFSCIGEDL